MISKMEIKALVCGAGDFIGSHLVIGLINEGYWVRGHDSDNYLIKEKLGWELNYPLTKGTELTYNWIYTQVQRGREV